MVQTRSSGIDANGTEQLLEKTLTPNKKRDNDSVNGNGNNAQHDDANTDLKNPAKRQKLPERTDPLRWRLRDDAGCQTWHYLEDDAEAKKWPQSLADKHFLGLPLVSLCFPVASFRLTNAAGR
jgi:hypothetical protein